MGIVVLRGYRMSRLSLIVVIVDRLTGHNWQNVEYIQIAKQATRHKRALAE
jgi:hypothetical protein